MVALLAVLIYFLLSPERTPPAPSSATPPPQKPPPTPIGSVATAPLAAGELQAVSSHPLAVSFGNNPELASSEAKQLLEILQFYRMEFGSFPAGQENRDIMHALTGNNPSKLPIFPRQHPRMDAEGQLLDAWGKPFHFHPQSSQHLEIRSHGPDGEIFTADDLIAPPQR